MLLMTGAAQAMNIAINGDFETGDFLLWTQFSNGGVQEITMDNPSSGAYAAHLSQFSANNSYIQNANIGIGLVNPGDTIDISFDMRGTTINGGLAFAEFFSEVNGGGTSAAEILGGGPLTVTPNWSTYNFSVIAGPDVSGGVTLQLGAVCDASADCSSDVYFDNVVVDVAPVPIPAAAWLFGSGLLGLIGTARRKKAV
jgi:hypothetical protein